MKKNKRTREREREREREKKHDFDILFRCFESLQSRNHPTGNRHFQESPSLL
jgi:hypothetical protein